MSKLENDILYREIFMSNKSSGGGTGGITPTGTKTIEVTQNGTVTSDVTDFATVKVDTNVPIPDGYVQPAGNLDITDNGAYDVSQYETTIVDVPQTGITPVGEIGIVDNGTYDVTDFASASVNVPIPAGYVIPSGTLNIIGNGAHDVSGKATAIVDVPIPAGYVKPAGKAIINIDTNGTIEQAVYDVADVQVNVNVPETIPDGYVNPEVFKNSITQVSQWITDLSGKFNGVTEEGTYPYFILTIPGFSTNGVKNFTNAFANWGNSVKTIPCSLNFVSNETSVGIFTGSKYIENLTVVEGSIMNDISFVPIKSLRNESIMSILKGLNLVGVNNKTIRLPSTCFNGQTQSIITEDADMNNVYQAAKDAGWTITFNFIE